MHKFIDTKFLFVCCLLSATACSNPQPGPDKTIGGAVLGAAWGAGTGAIVGHQVEEFSRTGEGVAIGAGFGFVSGAAAGLGYDNIEDTQIEQEQQITALQVQNATNRQEIASIQRRLDNMATKVPSEPLYQVFFDSDETSLKAGDISNLEALAESLKTSPANRIVNIVGHSDDAGSSEDNATVANARAVSVHTFLAAKGVRLDQMRVSNAGASKPIASNSTEAGRQLNRRVDIFLSKK